MYTIVQYDLGAERRKGETMVRANDFWCLHCEQRPSRTRLGLCLGCHRRNRVRELYLHRRGWTPEWEAHLRRLTRRAQAGLPLFGGAGLEPNRAG
jgi:hypothetical protein